MLKQLPMECMWIIYLCFLKYSFKYEHEYFIGNTDNDSHIHVDTPANICMFGLTDTQLSEMGSSSVFSFKTNKGNKTPDKFSKLNSLSASL